MWNIRWREGGQISFHIERSEIFHKFQRKLFHIRRKPNISLEGLTILCYIFIRLSQQKTHFCLKTKVRFLKDVCLAAQWGKHRIIAARCGATSYRRRRCIIDDIHAFGVMWERECRTLLHCLIKCDIMLLMRGCYGERLFVSMFGASRNRNRTALSKYKSTLQHIFPKP